MASLSSSMGGWFRSPSQSRGADVPAKKLMAHFPLFYAKLVIKLSSSGTSPFNYPWPFYFLGFIPFPPYSLSPFQHLQRELALTSLTPRAFSFTFCSTNGIYVEEKNNNNNDNDS